MRRAALAAAALLAGCATPVPTVTYHTLADAPPGDAAVPYQLTDSRLVIGVVPDGNGKDPTPPVSLDPVTVACDDNGCLAEDGHAPLRLAMAVVPIPFAGTVLAIVPSRRGLITISLGPTYFPNSLRLQALVVEAKDHRIEVIDAVGTIARGLAGAAAGKGMAALRVALPVPLHLPVIVDLARARTALTDDVALSPLGNPGWTMAASFLDDPQPAALGFRSRATAGAVHHAVLTSICRPFRLSLIAGAAELRFEAAVADPDWLVAIPFPAKGAVILHPLCGADVQAQPVAAIGLDAIAAAFVGNVNAIGAAAK